MLCPKCNSQVPDGAAFCGSCGARVGAAAPPPPAQLQYAPPPQYPPQQAPAYYPGQQPKRGGSTCWIVGCLALLLVLVVGAIGGYLLLRSMNNGEFKWSWHWPPGGPQTTADEQAARKVVEDFYAAWADGDLQAGRALCTDEYAALLTAETFGSGYNQHSARILEARQVDQDHWQVVGEETFDDLNGGRTTERSTIDVLRVGQDWRINWWQVDTTQASSSGGQVTGGTDAVARGRIGGGPAGGANSTTSPGGSTSLPGGGADQSGPTTSRQSGGAIPSPMPTLNAFLTAAGGDDGSKLLPFMTDQLKSEFSVTAEIWGQGDFDHVGWNVTSQNRVSDTQWSFEVKETCRDWGDGSLFYDTRLIDMTWNGSAWQVSRFSLLER